MNLQGGHINHIKNENGLVLMPHHKESSGYMKIYEEDSLLYEFDFIEILNGLELNCI